MENDKMEEALSSLLMLKNEYNVKDNVLEYIKINRLIVATASLSNQNDVVVKNLEELFFLIEVTYNDITELFKIAENLLKFYLNNYQIE